jgi:hypothetical protein
MLYHLPHSMEHYISDFYKNRECEYITQVRLEEW